MLYSSVKYHFKILLICHHSDISDLDKIRIDRGGRKKWRAGQKRLALASEKAYFEPSKLKPSQGKRQMTDQQPEQATEPEQAQAVAPGGTDGTGSDDKFTMENVEKRYFAPDQLEDAQTYLGKVTNVCPDGAIKRNFDPEEVFPDGYGLAVVPISKRSLEKGGGNISIGIVVAAIPDPASVANHEKGGEFIRSAITDVFMAKVANSCRPRPDGTTATTIPFTIEDFIESRRGRESLKAFTEVASAFVKALRKKGIIYMTPGLLRQTLQSKAFAATQFEKINQDAWQKVLDAMIVKAKAAGHDPAILVNWKDTRDSVEVVEIEDLDLDDLDSLVG